METSVRCYGTLLTRWLSKKKMPGLKRTDVTTDMVETHTSKATDGGKALSSSHMTSSETMTRSHVLYEPAVFGNRMTLCGLSAPWRVQSAGAQTARGRSNSSTWRGMFPGVTFTLSSSFWGSAEAPSHCKPHLCKILLNT